jgi:hypothetical protein
MPFTESCEVKLTKIDTDRAFVNLVSHIGCICLGFLVELEECFNWRGEKGFRRT